MSSKFNAIVFLNKLRFTVAEFKLSLGNTSFTKSWSIYFKKYSTFRGLYVILIKRTAINNAKKIRLKKVYFKNLYLINLKALVIISYVIKDT